MDKVSFDLSTIVLEPSLIIEEPLLNFEDAFSRNVRYFQICFFQCASYKLTLFITIETQKCRERTHRKPRFLNPKPDSSDPPSSNSRSLSISLNSYSALTLSSGNLTCSPSYDHFGQPICFDAALVNELVY